MVGLRTIRRRDGATFWALFYDAEEPRQYTEYFVVDTWLEHVRQHGRGTVSDQYIRERVRQFQTGEPVIKHYIAAQTFRGRG